MVVETIVGTVLLLYAPCPTPDAAQVAGCTLMSTTPPTVHVLPRLTPRFRRYVLRHELGHVVCHPDPSEACADRWAKKHPGRVILE